MTKSKKVFDINELSKEQVESLSVQIGEQVTVICDRAVEKANRLLKEYGMESKISFHIQPLGTFAVKNSPQESEKRNLTDNEQV